MTSEKLISSSLEIEINYNLKMPKYSKIIAGTISLILNVHKNQKGQVKS